MREGEKILVVLPAYNEEGGLRLLLPKLRGVLSAMGLPYHVLVVNDGSTDATAQVLQEWSSQIPLTVISHRYNRGLGETVRNGFEAAVEMCGPKDIIVRLDADNTHDPKYIPVLVNILRQGYDVVIASRFAGGSKQVGISLGRKLLSWGAMLLMKVCFPMPGIWDYSCGFRAYRARCLQEAIAIFQNDFIDLKGLGFTATAEKLIKLRMLGVRAAEVPFELRYDLKGSESKMVSRITVIGYLVLCLKYSYPWGQVMKKRLSLIAALRKGRQAG